MTSSVGPFFKECAMRFADGWRASLTRMGNVSADCRVARPRKVHTVLRASGCAAVLSAGRAAARAQYCPGAFSTPFRAFAGDGQREGDGRAEADSRLGADLPAVGFDQAFGYGQPKSGASGLGAGHRQEAVEEAREIFRRNAMPSVGD